MWVEGEKLYMWALMVALLALVMRRQREQLLPGAMLAIAGLAAAGVLLGKPFTQPLPSFLSQYAGYLQAMTMGGVAADSAYQGMEATRQFYYNAWFMWVHPPLLFFSYGAFVLSFIATLQMVSCRHSSFETTAYRWACLGYLPLTVGMLLGFPWALSAWTGEAWWWSGKVNMSIMMWLLYTAYLHARLYLRREHMWRVVAALSILSFVILVLTYIATYVIPGAHSYALAPASQALAALAAACRGGAT
jgi:cytochrome c biogenesis factor